jgi:hypothetical protein
MNSDVMHSRVQMEPRILKQLVTEVKETVATDVKFARAGGSSYGILQLWNMRRKSRYAGAGRSRRKPTIITGLSY